MLNSAHIQNFRLFKDFQIDDLARVNLIVGKNNVGKSSLLEALYLLVNPKSRNVLFTLLENRKEFVHGEPRDNSRIYPRTIEYDISHIFFGHRLEHGTAIRLDSEGMPFTYKLSYMQDPSQLALLDEFDPDINSYLLLGNENESKSIKIPLEDDLIVRERRNVNRRLSRSSSQKIISNYITTEGFDYNLLADLWDDIATRPRENDIYKILQIIDPNVERLAFTRLRASDPGILIKRQHEETGIPLGSMGDGMHRILTIAIALANSENRVLLIDEIDTGLHYRVLTDMWRVVMETAVRLNIQVFATTHSYDCMRSFAEALSLMEDDSVGALFRLQQRGEKIEAARYEAERITFAIEQDIEIR